MSLEGKAEAQCRRDNELIECLGEPIRKLLSEDGVFDILVNPDGKLWVDRIGSGREFSGMTIPESDRATILRLVAFRVQAPITARDPIVDNATLPVFNQRISGARAPTTDGSCFAIRIPPREILTDFPDGERRVVEAPSARGESEFDGARLDVLRRAVAEYKNVAIAGATGSGKTSLMSCLMREMAARRLLVFEGVRELIISSDDHVRFVAIKGVVTLERLLELGLRMRPDGIIVGEIRSADEARILVQSSNTGHRGNITGLHANSAEETINRLVSLCSNSTLPVPQRDITSAIDMVAYLEKRRIVEVIDLRQSGYAKDAA